MAIPILPEASAATVVLLLQAPYPGRLKFDGQPSSILHAIAPFAHRLHDLGRLAELGWLDPGTPSEGYRLRLAQILANTRLRVLCISTTNASIEEAAWAAQTARAARGDDIMIILGGPHEDDVAEKAATRIPQVDLSIGGDAEFVLDFVLRTHLDQAVTRAELVPHLWESLPHAQLKGGQVSITAASRGTLQLELPPIQPEDLLPPVWTTKRVTFSVFEDRLTLPVLLSRGCSYGKCTFCSEPLRSGSRVVRTDLAWLRELAALHPGAAIYFQDSIFPQTREVREDLLPLLRDLQVPWGAQVYLRALNRPWLEALRSHGCTYLYTGIESGSEEIRSAVGKSGLTHNVVLERLTWMRDLGFRVGVSLMFGAISTDGRLLETPGTVRETEDLARAILELGVPVTGFYPNILTVLAGTPLERSLHSRGTHLDYYRTPKAPAFHDFEDGGVGYNFTTIPSIPPAPDVATAVLALKYPMT